ncbi:MAG: hypothetical protein Q4G43_15845 [Mobilicoccus sp.]|nr:hypothetical protein [Mobilicoccus sp.]
MTENGSTRDKVNFTLRGSSPRDAGDGRAGAAVRGCVAVGAPLRAPVACAPV